MSASIASHRAARRGRGAVVCASAALAAAWLLLGVVSVAGAAPATPAAGTGATAQASPATTAAQAASSTTYGWVVQLRGALSRDLTSGQFVALAAKYSTWNDGTHTWTGVPLWRLVALVDDKNAATFDASLAKKGYSIQVVGLGGVVTLTSTDGLWVGKNDVLVADLEDSLPLAFGTLAGATSTPRRGRPSSSARA